MSRQTLVFFMLISLFSNLYAQNGHFLKRQIERAIAYENRYDSSPTTGLIIGCSDNDSSWVFPFGNVSKTLNQKPDESTFFEIGSLTQTFTAANIQFLVQQGLVNLDSTINTYLKPAQQFAAGYKITVLHLLTHTSGLPKFTDDWGTIETNKEQPYSNYTEGGFFDFLKRHNATEWQQGHYLFSALNYVLLGQILKNQNEAAWWQPFADKSFVALAQGYNLGHQPVPTWQVVPLFEPAVGGCTNMTQLMGFMQWQLNIDSLDKNGLLKETQQVVFPTKINKHTFVGKGWHIFKFKKRFPICLSSGATNGHSAVMIFMPQTKTGVVILSNSRVIQGSLAMSILKILNNNWIRKY